MRRLIGRFLRDESGATAIEYGLMCALIFLGIVISSTGRHQLLLKDRAG